MQISDDLRKAVVFLGEDITGPDGEPDIDPKGTGFMVTLKSDSSFAFPKGLPVENESAGIYLVTAKHVAEWHKSNFVIRFNKKGGGSGIKSIAEPHWHYHPDETVDVAVLHCGRPDWADCVMVPGGLFVTPAKYMTPSDVISNDPHIGIGDITYVVGLFHLLHGKKVNLPVVHTGHIALLPEDEKIPVVNRITNQHQEVEGYLVEAHGLEGLSGAPVFARISMPIYADYRAESEPPLRAGRQAGRMHSFTVLLGLWQSSWEGVPSDPLAKDKKLKGQKIPVGFGVVVPAYKIAETLNLEELVMSRRAEYDRRVRENAAITDSFDTNEALPIDDANPNPPRGFHVSAKQGSEKA